MVEKSAGMKAEKTDICRRVRDLPALFQGVADIFEEQKDHLCEMDAAMGDGDLGLTMSKGYGALPGLIKDQMQEASVAKTLMKAAMKMQGLLPSTMGTLMSTGVMYGGKAVGDKPEMDAKDLAAFLEGFATGIQKRGKCQPGDRTIYDSVLKAAEAGKKALEEGGGMKAVMDAAVEGAKEGVEATKEMTPKYGKAAVFAARAKGVEDQGAVAGMYLMEGLARYFS